VVRCAQLAILTAASASAAKSAKAGIDPRHLLIDVTPEDNVREITDHP
jgi:hypothetical protein